MPAASASPDYFGTQQDYNNMFQMIFGGYVAQIIHTVARLSLAEHFANGLNTPEAIAQAQSLDPEATFRLLRACVSIGLLSYHPDSGFAATSMLHVLHADAPNSMRGLALVLTASGHWLPWGRLEQAIRTGEPQAVAALGKSVWQHLADTPHEAAAFTDAMISASHAFNLQAVNLIDTRQSALAVDVGGASGSLVQALMSVNTTLEGHVFDLPHVVPAALEAAQEAGVANRFGATGGDFLADPLPAADLYLLKLILHDWSDKACASLLDNCRKSIQPNGRLIVVEQILGDIGVGDFTPVMDLNMLVMLGGKERTLAQYTELLAAHGFKIIGVTPTTTPFSIIEAVAV